MLYIFTLLLGCAIGLCVAKNGININHTYSYPQPPTITPIAEDNKVEQDQSDFQKSVAAALQDVFDLNDEE